MAGCFSFGSRLNNCLGQCLCLRELGGGRREVGREMKEDIRGQSFRMKGGGVKVRVQPDSAAIIRRLPSIRPPLGLVEGGLR